MKSFELRHIFILCLLPLLAACNTRQQSPEDLKERTAQATADIKRDAKAVAAGIREGWSRDKPLDLNSATRDQLVDLPSITTAQADRILAGRPYNKPEDLVTRRILSKAEYAKVADRVVAK